jgi:hypothetical protein
VFIFIFFLSLPSVLAQSKTFNNFRGIKWGSSRSNAISILCSQDIRSGPGPADDTTLYSVIDEETEDEDGVSEVTFDEWWPEIIGVNHYTLKFLKDRFSYVEVLVESGIDGFRGSYKVLLSKYGKPTKTIQRAKTIFGQPESKYLWQINNLLISLDFLPSDEGEVTTSGKSKITYETKIWSQYVTRKKEADDKNLLKNAPKF